MDFDQVQQRLDPKVGECHAPFVTDSIDPDESIRLVHFIGNVTQLVPVFAARLNSGAGSS